MMHNILHSCCSPETLKREQSRMVASGCIYPRLLFKICLSIWHFFKEHQSLILLMSPSFRNGPASAARIYAYFVSACRDLYFLINVTIPHWNMFLQLQPHLSFVSKTNSSTCPSLNICLKPQQQKPMRSLNGFTFGLWALWTEIPLNLSVVGYNTTQAWKSQDVVADCYHVC